MSLLRRLLNSKRWSLRNRLRSSKDGYSIAFAAAGDGGGDDDVYDLGWLEEVVEARRLWFCMLE